MNSSGPASDANEGVRCIPQSSSITGASPSDCLVSYPGHSLEQSYPSAEMQSMYFAAPADLAISYFLNVKTVQFQTIQFSRSKQFFLFTHSLM